jgi:hypothetical protein
VPGSVSVFLFGNRAAAAPAASYGVIAIDSPIAPFMGKSESTACVLSGFSDWNRRLKVSDFIPWEGGRRSRWRWPWRCQLPGSVRDRRHDRAAIRGLRRVFFLDFQGGIAGTTECSSIYRSVEEVHEVPKASSARIVVDPYPHTIVRLAGLLQRERTSQNCPQPLVSNRQDFAHSKC